MAIKPTEIQDLLRQQADALAEEAAHNGGQIDPERIRALSRLYRLNKICDGLQSPPRRGWRGPVMVLLASLLLASLLFFGRIFWETEIEMDLAVSEIGFVLPVKQALTEGVALQSTGAFGVREIELPRLPPLRGRFAHLEALQSGEDSGTISLQGPILPPGTSVRVEHMGHPNRLRLFIQKAGGGDSLPVLQGAVAGLLAVVVADGPRFERNFGTPKPLRLLPEAGEADLTLTFAQAPSRGLFRHLKVESVSLDRVEQLSDSSGTLVRRASTILGGKLSLVALYGLQRPLRAEERLAFASSRGELRLLPGDDHLDLKFHGYVRGMRSGSDESGRSLMPTYLEWLEAQHGWKLMWGMALYLFTLAVSALRWLGVDLLG